MKNIIASLLIWITVGQPAFAATGGFQIVVNPANAVSSVDQKFISDAFLRKTTYWPNMKSILVVDLDSDSQVRRLFSEKVLERHVSSVRSYWQQVLFSGRGVPPPELKSDQEVINFVNSNATAIGYVSEGADLRGLKVVEIK